MCTCITLNISNKQFHIVLKHVVATIETIINMLFKTNLPIIGSVSYPKLKKNTTGNKITRENMFL